MTYDHLVHSASISRWAYVSVANPPACSASCIGKLCAELVLWITTRYQNYLSILFDCDFLFPLRNLDRNLWSFCVLFCCYFLCMHIPFSSSLLYFISLWSQCTVKTYVEWLKDGDYTPTSCGLCHSTLENDAVRLICLRKLHYYASSSIYFDYLLRILHFLSTFIPSLCSNQVPPPLFGFPFLTSSCPSRSLHQFSTSNHRSLYWIQTSSIKVAWTRIANNPILLTPP